MLRLEATCRMSHTAASWQNQSYLGLGGNGCLYRANSEQLLSNASTYNSSNKLIESDNASICSDKKYISTDVDFRTQCPLPVETELFSEERLRLEDLLSTVFLDTSTSVEQGLAEDRAGYLAPNMIHATPIKIPTGAGSTYSDSLSELSTSSSPRCGTAWSDPELEAGSNHGSEFSSSSLDLSFIKQEQPCGHVTPHKRRGGRKVRERNANLNDILVRKRAQ